MLYRRLLLGKVPARPFRTKLTLLITFLSASSLCFTPAAQAQMRSESATLRVRVLNHRTEAVLDQVRVELVRFPSEVVNSGFTDSSGGLEFDAVEPGSYLLRAFKSGFQFAETRVDIGTRDRMAEASIAMEPEDQASGSSGGKVSARTLSLPPAAVENFQKGLDYLQDKKNARQSLEFLQKAIALSPDYYEAYFLEGMAYMQLNSTKQAETAFRKTLELKPDFINAYYPLAMVLFGQKRYDEEEQLVQEAMKQNADGWQWPFELARCSALRGHWDKALEYGHMASQKPAAPSKVHLLMGDLYSNTGHIPEAISEFEQFVRMDPQSTYMPKVEKALASLRAAAKPAVSANRQ